METETITKKYDWTNYNRSQTKEKIFFMKLLRELCDLIENPIHQKGRKPVNYGDMIYSLALKTYETNSSRRACSELKLASQAKFLEKPFHFNTLLKYLENSEVTLILQELIELSALPLKQTEKDFAVDSTGFSTSSYERWFDARLKRDSSLRKFRKAHAICGVRSNIIVGLEVTDGYAADTNYFKPLIDRASENFKLKEISGDKGYLSTKNFLAAQRIGATAYLAFKVNSKRGSKRRRPKIWRQAFEHFRYNQEDYLKRYHKRSNIESTFSMIKARFGTLVRCKNIISQDNEIRLKCLCHNICILIQEIFMSKTDVDFYESSKSYLCT